MPVTILGLLNVLGSKVRSSRAARDPSTPREQARVDPRRSREVEVFVSCRYEPAHVRVKTSERVRLTFIRTMWNGCAPELLIPALDLRCELRRNQPVIVDLPRLAPGQYQFSCGTRAIVGTITVTSGS